MRPRTRLLGLLSAGSLLALCAVVSCGGRTPLGVGRATGSGEGGQGGQAVATTTGPGGGSPCGPEVCDGVDNDCDGIVDDGCACEPGSLQECYAGPPGTVNVGPCQAGVSVCGDDGQPGPCSGDVSPTAEVCDGLDNDCNAATDEGNPGGGAACATGGLGPCAAGTLACLGGVLSCAQSVFPTPETCDGIDNDCDGTVDNGCTPGCSDGSREGFVDATSFPEIAGCSGGFSVPGVIGSLPACGGASGNSSANPSGQGCSAADLCGPGFHLCSSAADVLAHAPLGCSGVGIAEGLFFATGQSSTGCQVCALGASTDPSVCDGCSCAGGCAQTTLTANDLFGCGTLGAAATQCGGLDRFSNNGCSALGPPWSCGNDGCAEATLVTKSSSAAGGVLCCGN